MIAHFFIDRPIFAAVLSIVITLTGFIALKWLPIAQYPEITPPSVQVSINYPGASAQVVADTVGAPIEQQVNGVQGMLYMSSQAGNDGSYTLTVTFDVGTDLNTALVMVQNRVQLAMPLLPTSVQQQGITIRKKTPDILLVVNFISPDGRYDDIYLSNFAMINVKDELLRLEGVSDINFLGERDYSIRIWLDPQKMASCNLSASDVVAAIRPQNLEAPAGQVGQPPAPAKQTYQVPISTLGRLDQPEQFADIVVKVSKGLPRTVTGAAAAGGSSGALPGTTVSSAPVSMGGTLGGPPGGTAAGSAPGISALTGAIGSTGTLGGTSSSTTSSSSSSSTTSPSSSTSPSSGSGSNTSSASSTSSPSTSSSASGSSSPSYPSTASTPAALSTSSASSQSQPGSVTGGFPGNLSGSVQGQSVPQGTTVGHEPQGTAAGIIRLRDVARIELAAQNYNQSSTFDGLPSVALGIHLLPGTNALDVADLVRAKMAELKERFPDGVDYRIAYDITPFVRESVDDVVMTLLEAVVLVAIVVLVFLQNWRAALIPLVAVPVAIVGTFAVMAALGFSLNNISLFGLVLAIGIVVDDAIVVVENVERWLEHGLGPREAARKAMDEVTGPVVAIALVLCAVFVPCAFLGGITGQFFRQFAVTIAASTVLSAINSLTLSPALAALLLRKRGEGRDPLTWVLDLALGWFFWLFNAAFSLGTSVYVWSVGVLLRLSLVVLLAYGGLLALTGYVFERAPTGFIPEQDQGRLIISVQLPDSASLQRTQEILAQVEEIAHDIPGVAHTITMSGMSLLLGANSSNFGTMFVILDPYPQRRSPERTAYGIMARMRREYAARVKDAEVTVLNAPPLPGLGVAGGFKLMVEDRGGLGLGNLQKQTDTLVARMQKAPEVRGSFTQFRSNTPQLYMDVNRIKVKSLGLSLGDVNQTLQVYLGSLYVNSFNRFGRFWQVTVMAEGTYRRDVSDIDLLQVRNNQGQMVPLGTLVDVREINGPVMVTRYNLYTAAPIAGNFAPGSSSGEAIASVEQMASGTLPRSMKTEWTELMYMQIRAGNTAFYVFALSVVFVFLALAALYESWTLPLAVILVVPLCLLCSIGGVLLAHLSVDIFVQIGLVVLLGLACKNAILIVEFARQLVEEGKPRREAVLEACRLRLRPILMTSFAFILGVVPLVIARGAGAEMRQSLGTAVFAGMLGVTAFGIFLTPVFFYVIEGLGEMHLLSGRGVRAAGSLCLGAVAGLALGFLAAYLNLVRAPWSLVGGSALGILAGLLVLGLRRAFRPRRATR